MGYMEGMAWTRRGVNTREIINDFFKHLWMSLELEYVKRFVWIHLQRVYEIFFCGQH